MQLGLIVMWVATVGTAAIFVVSAVKGVVSKNRDLLVIGGAALTSCAECLVGVELIVRGII